ncbi:DUF4328 domain-containing protein [Phaeacidiphilus oryzae]|uniref:DUF4328 domain-containing protein n=1 Tax=Phaeacidiphilus oryzae TaxID=348818 RepID=UPI000561B85F|nr:DUF4328 domain-containing protein [Phaeacidiphilus oryzae]
MLPTPTEWSIPRWISVLVRSLLGCQVLISLLGVAYYLVGLDSWRQEGSGGDPSADASVLHDLHLVLGEPAVTLYTLTGIAFIVWLRKARSAAEFISPDATLDTPAWTVACWVIPIGTYFLPYQVVRKIWLASEPRGQQPAAGPVRSPLVLTWWLLFVVARLSGGLVVEIPAQFSVGGHEVMDGVLAGCDLVRAAAAVLAMVLVHRLGTLQQARAAQLFSRLPGQPAPAPQL